jgi:hypothetical protein
VISGTGEAEASSIRVNAHVIPGILQTPAYAHDVISRTRPATTSEDAERRVAARTARGSTATVPGRSRCGRLPSSQITRPVNPRPSCRYFGLVLGVGP